jgi:hypothetical protein
MPESDNFQALIVWIQPVDNSIRFEDDFADIGFLKLGHNSASLWKGIQGKSSVKQLIANSLRSRGIVRRDVSDDAL